MMYKELKNRIKEEQKSLALKIRNGKTGRKPVNKTVDNFNDFNALEWNQVEYRHRHIIYCNMFNNTPYDLIEQPRDNNAPRTYKLDEIRDNWEKELDEAVCNSA